MGGCASKPSPEPNYSNNDLYAPHGTSIPAKDDNDGKNKSKEEAEVGNKSPFFPFYSPSPAHYFFSNKSPAASSTPRRFFKRSFPPPSPAKHIRALLARRQGSVKPNAIPEGNESEGDGGLDKSFGFSKNFGNKYELGEEIGRGHFGYTCKAKFKKGELKGQDVAVKVIPKAKVWNFLKFDL